MSAKIRINLLEQLLGHNGAIYCMGVFNQSLYTCGSDGWLVQWQPNKSSDGKLIAETNQAIYSMLVDETNIYLGSYSQNLIKISNRELAKSVIAHNKGVFFIKKWNKQLITGGGDGILNFWNQDLELLKSIKLSRTSLRCATIFNNTLLVGSSDGIVYTLTDNAELLQQLNLNQSSIFDLNVHENTIFAACKSAKIAVIEGGKTIAVWDAHMGLVHGLALNPEFDIIASTSMDKTCRLWSVNGELLAELNKAKYGAHLSSVNAAVWFTPNCLITCSDDKSIMLYDLELF